MRLLSKSALAILVAKIEELAAVRVNLNLLTDKSVMKLAESLSLIQRNVKENSVKVSTGSAQRKKGAQNCPCKQTVLQGQSVFTQS